MFSNIFKQSSYNLGMKKSEMFFRKAKLTDAQELSRLRRGVFGKVNGEEYSKGFVNLINKTNSPQGIIKNIESYDVFCLIKSKKIIIYIFVIIICY